MTSAICSSSYLLHPRTVLEFLNPEPETLGTEQRHADAHITGDIICFSTICSFVNHNMRFTNYLHPVYFE